MRYVTLGSLFCEFSPTMRARYSIIVLLNWSLYLLPSTSYLTSSIVAPWVSLIAISSSGSSHCLSELLRLRFPLWKLHHAWSSWLSLVLLWVIVSFLLSLLNKPLLLIRDYPLCLTVENLSLSLEYLLADTTMLSEGFFIEASTTTLALVQILLHLLLESLHTSRYASSCFSSSSSRLSCRNHLIREFWLFVFGLLLSLTTIGSPLYRYSRCRSLRLSLDLVIASFF